MKEEEKKEIEHFNDLNHLYGIGVDTMKYTESEYDNSKILLSLIEKQQAEIEKKDKTVKHIIERLENDIKRITETKTKKSEHYLDDYTRNRLKAYKTKTKEIKEYIEKQYFNQKIEKGE